MADTTGTNGCYVLTNEGKKFPISRSLARALEKIVVEQKNATGAFTIHMKSGGVAAVEVKTMFVE